MPTCETRSMRERFCPLSALWLRHESAVLGLIFLLVFLLVYLPVIELEEQHLRQIFPSYAAYAVRVNRFLPYRKWQGNVEAFSWPLYWKNQEYKAALGFAIAVAWLVWRCS